MKKDTARNVTLLGWHMVRHRWWPWRVPHPVRIELAAAGKPKSVPEPAPESEARPAESDAPARSVRGPRGVDLIPRRRPDP